MRNSDFRTRIRSLHGSQASPAISCMLISMISTSVHGSSPSTVVLCIQNTDFIPRIAGLHMSQPSSVGLYIPNSEFSPRKTSPNGSQTSLVVCACKTAWLLPFVSMGPSPHLWFCAFKTAYLASELLVSIGPRPHLWLLHVQQRL